jgi:vacuolar-type H+-ATPase subunit D/Vma8
MTAGIRVNIKYDNVAGVRLPVFTVVRCQRAVVDGINALLMVSML